MLLLRCLLVRVAAAAVPWRFIDLLPQHAGKGTAMQHVMQHYGFDATSTVAAGDSANDLLMLKQVGWHFVHSIYCDPFPWLPVALVALRHCLTNMRLLVAHGNVQAHFCLLYHGVIRVHFAGETKHHCRQQRARSEVLGSQHSSAT
jgi:hypothetical protein